MTKTVRSRYTLEFKQDAVRQVQSGQSMAAAGRSLGVAEQTLFNWVKVSREGRLSRADSKPVSAEQMEICPTCCSWPASLCIFSYTAVMVGKGITSDPRTPQ